MYRELSQVLRNPQLEWRERLGYLGQLLLGRERVQHSQLIKQADVVALLALLPETFAAGSHTTNFRYYEPRCCHASSLSPAMHGLAAARRSAGSSR